jgi:hypothetical protein
VSSFTTDVTSLMASPDCLKYDIDVSPSTAIPYTICSSSLPVHVGLDLEYYTYRPIALVATP